MKIFQSLLLLILCISCGIEYDGETRLVVETKIEDTEGNPLKNIAIEVVAADLYNSESISDGQTNEDGNLLLIFPAAKSDSASYKIIIHGDEMYRQKEYHNIKESEFIDYKLSLNNVVLFRTDQVTTLIIDVENVNSNSRFDGYSIEAQMPDDFIDYDQTQEAEYYYESIFAILKNQTVIIHYTLTDLSSNISTDHTVAIPVGSEPVTYEITY